MPNTITTITAIGIDLGDTDDWRYRRLAIQTIGDTDAHYAFLNQEGKLVEEGRVAMTPAGLRKAFFGNPNTRIALEAGAQSRWISKLLGEYGHEVIVANPIQSH
jgi:hypothetical protein